MDLLLASLPHSILQAGASLFQATLPAAASAAACNAASAGGSGRSSSLTTARRRCAAVAAQAQCAVAMTKSCSTCSAGRGHQVGRGLWACDKLLSSGTVEEIMHIRASRIQACPSKRS